MILKWGFLVVRLVGFLLFLSSFNSALVVGAAEYRCSKCKQKLCDRCERMNVMLKQKVKERDRLNIIIGLNKEALKARKDASGIIKINSNLLLASVTKDALDNEIANFDGLISECGSCRE